MIENKTESIIVSIEDESMRLDKFLANKNSDWSLRECRRLIENGIVKVNERTAKSALKLKSGMQITFSFASKDYSKILHKVKVLHRNNEYVAIHKPAGVHSAEISGSLEISVEEILPNIIKGDCYLVNRLDFKTSGILIAAFSNAGVEKFRQLEDEGRVVKKYHALVHNSPVEELLLTGKLMVDNRKISRLTDIVDDKNRWTTVKPISPLENGMTLVEARIKKGARHQIRVHLSGAGYPIYGDDLYGISDDADRMYLHHNYISFDDFSASDEVHWEDL